MVMQGGHNISGKPVGVISLDSRFPKPPGHIKNPGSLSFPVLFSPRVQGVTVARLLREPGDKVLELVLDAARYLEDEGAGAITGSCGFLALYQREIADAVSVPVFVSSLIQVPMVSRMLGGGRRIGVMTASADSLTAKHFQAVGADMADVAIVGMDDQPEFRDVILDGKRHDMDLAKIEAELLDAADRLASTTPDLGAVILECTDMSHFAQRIQARLNLPIFDLTSLTTMVATAISRNPYRDLRSP
ncbi:MAG: aspartate/glutamate racemase family protein [Rhodospirillaceae bacterium]|jgi:Asp/Glu/hydantoin racemase|nr:aspartate/glutamate racemase family protein [Rhodospirillaceae bacterium]